MSSNYDVGTRAWQPDAAEGWVASEVTKKQVDGDNVILTFKLESGEVSSSGDCSGPSSTRQTLTQRVQEKEVKIPLATLEKGTDESLPPLMNPTVLEASDDLTNLSHLNEPAGMVLLPHNPQLAVLHLTRPLVLQSCKPSSFATSKKKSTHTPVSC